MVKLTDNDLIGILDTGPWLARGGSVALGCPGTLRQALCRAHLFSPDGRLPTAIVKMTNEDLRISAAQIRRLWKRIRLT